MATAGAVAGRHVVLKVVVAASPGTKMAVLERHAQRSCEPCCCKKQNSRNQVLTGFESPTPGRDPKVTRKESGCLTSH